MPTPDDRPPPARRVIISDFDGTMVVGDVTDGLCQRYVPHVRQEMRRLSRLWQERRISGREFTTRYYEAMDLRKHQVDAFLPSVEVCPGLDDLLQAARDLGWEFLVLSGGFDYYIREILGRRGPAPAHVANRLIFAEDGGIRVEFHNEDDPACTLRKPSCDGCKPLVWDAWKARGYRIAYVGDGLSDYCVADRMQAGAGPGDLLFAKDGLLRYCRERDIAAIPYTTLADVADRLRRDDSASAPEH